MQPFAKKSLGQHFLRSKSVAQSMCEAAHLSNEDTVLEIGPGTGALTEVLLERAKKVIALELDDRMIEYLNGRFAKEITEGKLELVKQDVREFDPTSVGLSKANYKVIANIPYYLTGMFLRAFLSSSIFPSDLIVLVQKEVAERVARSPKESLLSLSVKVYGTPKYVGTVKRGQFAPPPSVDSAVLAVNNISKALFLNSEEEKAFFEAIHAGFGKKRKFLARNLEEVATKERIERVFTALELPSNARAEDVPLIKWVEIARSFASQK